MVTWQKYVSLLIIGLACTSCDDGTKYKFATYEDVRSDRTVIGASVPEFLPASARNIVGWYHVETNRQSLEFTFAAFDKDRMIESFALVQGADAVCTKKRLVPRRWSDNGYGGKLELYSRAADELIECLAIDAKGRRAYYWTVLENPEIRVGDN